MPAVRWASGSLLLLPLRRTLIATGSALVARALLGGRGRRPRGGRRPCPARACGCPASRAYEDRPEPRGSSVAPLRAAARTPLASQNKVLRPPSRRGPSLAAQTIGSVRHNAGRIQSSFDGHGGARWAPWAAPPAAAFSRLPQLRGRRSGPEPVMSAAAMPPQTMPFPIPVCALVWGHAEPLSRGGVLSEWRRGFGGGSSLGSPWRGKAAPFPWAPKA